MLYLVSVINAIVIMRLGDGTLVAMIIGLSGWKSAGQGATC